MQRNSIRHKSDQGLEQIIKPIKLQIIQVAKAARRAGCLTLSLIPGPRGV